MSDFEHTLLGYLIPAICYIFLGLVCLSPFLMLGGFVWSVILRLRLALWAFGGSESVGTVRVSSHAKKPTKAVKTKATPRPSKRPSTKSKPVVSEFSDEYKLPALPFE